MIRSSAAVLLLALFPAASAAPVRLRCNFLANPMGIDAHPLQFSWQSDSTARNWRQSACQRFVRPRHGGIRLADARQFELRQCPHRGQLAHRVRVAGAVYRRPHRPRAHLHPRRGAREFPSCQAPILLPRNAPTVPGSSSL